MRSVKRHFVSFFQMCFLDRSENISFEHHCSGEAYLNGFGFFFAITTVELCAITILPKKVL